MNKIHGEGSPEGGISSADFTATACREGSVLGTHCVQGEEEDLRYFFAFVAFERFKKLQRRDRGGGGSGVVQSFSAFCLKVHRFGNQCHLSWVRPRSLRQAGRRLIVWRVHCSASVSIELNPSIFFPLGWKQRAKNYCFD